MQDSGEIIWQGKPVGQGTITSVDMWYMDADWISNQSEVSKRFENTAAKLEAAEVIKSPTKGIIVEFIYKNAPSRSDRFLVLGLENSKLFLRCISKEIADWVDRKLLHPWQETDKPSFYENELKRELTFFHPLKWKKVKAIGVRTDRDDVLFELITGKSKYAVVHLTWAKEKSTKFPSTKFYRDWPDVYQECILKDHKEWSER
jgi:hypothetical protein